MNLRANEQSDLLANEQSGQPTGRAADRRRMRARFCRVGLAAVALLGTGMLAAACGLLPRPVVTGHLNPALGLNQPLAFVNCMRTHGEPNMPNLVIKGRSVNISIKVGSGVDPNSPQFAAAFKACKHLTSPGMGSAPGGPAITTADQADYLKAVACMRSHGFPKFPDPVFQNNNVTFISRTPIDTNTPRYQRALATCDKLIPADLPDSGRSPSAS